MVYLILYLVIGGRQIFGIVCSTWLGATPGFELLRKDDGGVPDCQVMLAYGLIALALIRVSAYWACLRRAPFRPTHLR